ncbi:MAG: CHAT domain-containing protein [Candidatus Binatia bacterium]
MYIAVDDPASEAAAALLDVPWELLAHESDFLAADPHQTFTISRSIGRRTPTPPGAAAYRDLAVMFMAASPEGQQELNFEEEEAAILAATAALPVQLVVEESGCLDFLSDRLALEESFEAVHFSCHGDLNHEHGPVLALETPEGAFALTTPGDVASALGERKIPLVFLSACRTAESLANTGEAKKFTAVEPFVRALIRAGAPNVLGWDGSVRDADAALFAQIFYQELGRFASVPYAAGVARRAVLREHRLNPQKGQHWHLARVYTGEQGGGPLCDRTKPKRRLRKAAGYREFLDKARARVPVATAQEFVGRRRQAQAVLKAFRHTEKAGVLLYGMGQIGKSSLAARIANRMPTHETVVIYERYDSLAMFEQLLIALPASERHAWDRQWREQITANGAILGDALEALLSGPFDEKPILLIIDDLEQILDIPQPTQRVTPVKEAPGQPNAWRVALSGVLRAFGTSETSSKLLITSRYQFTLPDGRERDLADTLEAVQVRPMRERERIKQWQAAQRTAAHVESGVHNDTLALAARIMEVASGNPGLQNILCRPLLSEEQDVARAALEAVERWKVSGEEPPETNAAQEFFQRLSFEIYRDALTETQKIQLRAATLFAEGLPTPMTALEAVGRAAGVTDPSLALARLHGLGLVDDWGELARVAHGAANPLARPLVGGSLTEDEQAALATIALEPLAKAWCSTDGEFPSDWRAVEAARVALKGNGNTEILERAAFAAGYYLFNREHNAKDALPIFEAARARLDAEGKAPRLPFLLVEANCAERLGERALQIQLLEKGLAQPSEDKVTRAQIAATHATATAAQDGPDKALTRLREAVALFEEVNDVRERAVTMGQIADILQQRGEMEEALRIHLEERLPTALVMQDLDSIAHIRFSCAQIRLSRRETWQSELQTIYEELAESFAIYQKIQRIDGIAVVGQLLGQILAMGGLRDEALTVLEQSARAYEKMQQTSQAEQVRALLRHVEKGQL